MERSFVKTQFKIQATTATSLTIVSSVTLRHRSHPSCPSKGLAKLGNIVAETMFLVMFSGVAKLGNICFGRKICVREAKMFLTPGKNIFCFRAAKFVSATHVSRAAKLGNICIRNNVSANVSYTLY